MGAINQSNLVVKNDELMPVIQQEKSGQSKYLTFLVNDTVHGIDLDHVKEIIEYDVLTQVPLAPPFIRGVFNLRGSVLPVIDLAVRLGKPAQPPGKQTCFVLVEIEGGGEGVGEVFQCGLYVDAVDAVVQIPDSAIEPPPTFGVDIRSDFIAGMGKRDEHFVILLDIERVGALEELAETMKTSAGVQQEDSANG